jgi:beta-lactamase regulating signal transducer with metallopeptidase domain
MMLMWMVYAALVGGLVAVAALAVDSAARVARVSVRWVWVAALSVFIALVVRFPSPDVGVAFDVPAAAQSVPFSAATHTSWIGRIRGELAQIRPLLDVSRAVRAVGATRVGAVNSRYLVGAWIAMSALLALIFAGVHARLRVARRRWPRAELHGQSVRVSTRIGPAAIGLVRSEVVIPPWLLARSVTDQQMAIAHEAEHVRAGDPQLLAAAWAVLILCPWNPALWLMIARLRLAIEVDCDRRVLRRGAIPNAYGSLLLAVAEQASPLRPSALALADDSSHLHTRIVAMDTSVQPFAKTRGGLAVLLGAAALLAACEAKAPTAADIDAMNGASAEKAARQLGVLQHVDTAVAYRVDGKTVTAEEARALGATEIAGVAVHRDSGASPEIRITTKHADVGRSEANPGDSNAVAVAAVMAQGRGGRVGGGGLVAKEWPSDTALVWFINDVRVGYNDVRVLDRSSIESVEIVKGRAAEAEYNVAPGKGVISIRTKSGR